MFGAVSGGEMSDVVSSVRYLMLCQVVRCLMKCQVMKCLMQCHVVKCVQ